MELGNIVRTRIFRRISELGEKNALRCVVTGDVCGVWGFLRCVGMFAVCGNVCGVWGCLWKQKNGDEAPTNNINDDIFP